MNEALRHIWDEGAKHGVNPLVFAVLYVAHHPLFWGTMAWLAARARRKQPLTLPALLGVFFFVMPYAYILIFGRGLPLWAYALAVLLTLIGGVRAYQTIRRRVLPGKLEPPL